MAEMEPASPSPTAAPPVSPPKFTLPMAAWVVWAIYATVTFALLVMRRATVTPFTIGETVGEVVAALLLPTIVAWIVWRLARRSATAATATFFSVFGAMLLGQAFQFAERVKANVALQKMAADSQQLQAAQREAIAKGQPVDEAKARQLAQRTAEQWAEVARNSSGDRRVAAEAGKAYLDQLLALKTRYDEAVAKIDAKSFWDLSRHQTAAAIAQSRAAVQAFAQANKELAAFQDRDGTALRREMEKRGASAALMQETIESYQKGSGGRLDLVVHIRETDAQFAGVMQAFLDLVEANLGKWKSNPDGKLAFENEAATQRARELLEQADAIGTRQAEFQSRIVAPKK